MDPQPVRRFRKQPNPCRAPSGSDISDGRVLTLSFGMINSSEIARATISQRGPYGTLTIPEYAAMGKVEGISSGKASQESHADESIHNDLKRMSVTNDTAALERNPSIVSADPVSDPQCNGTSGTDVSRLRKGASLANLYLDTMVPDDTWRRLCLHEIKRKRKYLRIIGSSTTKSGCRAKTVEEPHSTPHALNVQTPKAIRKTVKIKTRSKTAASASVNSRILQTSIKSLKKPPSKPTKVQFRTYGTYRERPKPTRPKFFTVEPRCKGRSVMKPAEKKQPDSSQSQAKDSSKKQKRPITELPTPPISPKISSHRRAEDSDSGFVSSLLSPIPVPASRIRSTRKHPIQGTAGLMSIDIPPSMVGRECLSCRCTNTTCWRRVMGGVICNSCGLRFDTLVTSINIRYKKCGIICANVKCRYIPTRGEIREMKARKSHNKNCYTCQGHVLLRGENALD